MKLDTIASALISPILLAAAIALPTTALAANDFPTIARVEYVEQCANDFDRPRRELLYKCSCAIDAVAKQVDYDTWVGLETFNNAVPIAGERGAYVRDRKDARTQVNNYREVQANARKACFLPEQSKQ